MRLPLASALFAVPNLTFAGLTLASLAFVDFSLPALAQDTADISVTAKATEAAANLTPATGSAGIVARLIEAHRLYQLGQSARDPLLVLAAARLMQGVTLNEVTRTTAEAVAPAIPAPEATDTKATDKKTKNKKAKDPAPPKTTPAPAEPAPTPPAPPKVVPDPAQSAPLPAALNPKAMLAEARAMLPATELLRDVIAQAEAETPPPGSVAQVTSLVQAAGGKTTFSLPLAGQSYGEVGLLRLAPPLGPNLTATGHLSMTVTDAAGNPVCVDASATAATLCGIIPRESGAFLVTITNDGATPAAYILITN